MLTAQMYKNQLQPTVHELANMIRAIFRLRAAAAISSHRPVKRTTGSKVTKEKTMR